MAGTIRHHKRQVHGRDDVSMESGLDGRNNLYGKFATRPEVRSSQWSPA